MAESEGMDDDVWNRAFKAVETQFEISSLFPEQKNAIRAFFESDKNVFVNLPTGFGKSMIYQSLPIVSDILFDKPRGSSVVVIISPLKALMHDQVAFLNDNGVPAISIGDIEDPEIVQQVQNGTYVLVFGSPECLLSTATWRGLFSAPNFKEMLICVAIDEAHCIVQWGLSGSKKVPFRKWYGCLGELNSMVPKEIHQLILTATATKATRNQILESLHLPVNDIVTIEQSPDRVNLSYVFCYLDKNEPLEQQFGVLISDLEKLGKDTPRTIIYCQTRKQCSVLFRMFEVYLGFKIYKDGSKLARDRLVEMFHAGTPQSVKTHICENMGSGNGHLRVLISTVAFGMGVNCKQVRRVIHFGPSKNVELYVQECGRAGRDGLPSVCVLLFNGLLSAHCDADMKKVMQEEGCLRKALMSHFISGSQIISPLHKCCSSCSKECKCGLSDCNQLWTPRLDTNPPRKLLLYRDESEAPTHARTRVVSVDMKETLRRELYAFQRTLLKEVRVGEMVTCPNILMEFNSFHINQVIEHCDKLFTTGDILRSVEIWRRMYASGILGVLLHVFGDIDVDVLANRGLDNDGEITVFSDWSQIRNDSSMLLMMDSQELDDMESFMNSTHCSSHSDHTLGTSGNYSNRSIP